MALNRSSMARVAGTDDTPVTFKVVGNPCQLRPGPNLDYFSIGLLRKASDVKGFPFIINGTTWIKLADEDAAIAVPDPARREDGVWLPQVHPKYGRLVQSKEEDVRYGAPGTKANGNGASQDAEQAGPVEGGFGFGKKVVLKPTASYEEMIQAEWTIETTSDVNLQQPLAKNYSQGVLEMVIDMASGRPPASGTDELLSPEKNGSGKWAVRPAKGAIVKRVPVGKDMKATVSNMPDSRYFLISVVVTFDGKHQLRSRWVRTATLHVDGRDKSLGNIDPGGHVRGKCEGKSCACTEFVPMGTWNLNSDPTVHCRRCGCPNDLHAIIGRANDALTRKQKEDVDHAEDGVGLPRESKDWDEREKNLWLWSNGALHPRQNQYAARKRAARDCPANKGRVSVVCPTMEERQVFHEQVWNCFCNQTWPDKELIIIETYQTRSSDYFRAVAARDERLVYLKFRCGQTTELSIGAKRNIAQHIATGDYISNFDDDDIYAPTYLSSMVKAMYDKSAAFVTLSSWYFFDIKSGRFGFFDAMEYARVKKMREKDIDGWLWGYGFSYLHKLQPALDKKIDYPDQNMEEDIKYIRAWKSGFGDQCTVLHFDDVGIVCHTLHGRNTSNSFALREVSREEVWDTDIGELSGCLDFYMRMFPRQEERSKFIEYEMDSGEVERRIVERKIQWLKGSFTLKTYRGVMTWELKQLCSEHLRIPYEAFRIHRQVPEGGFTDLRTPSEEKKEEAQEEQQQQQQQQQQQHQRQEQELPFAAWLGTWVYGSKATEYVMSAAGDRQLKFTGPHSRVGTVSGVCKGVGQWAQCELLSPDGEKIGAIRLKYIPEADKMISNYRSLNREDWGKDIHAVRKDRASPQNGSSSAGAESPTASEAAERPEFPQNTVLPTMDSEPVVDRSAPLWDEERIGNYVQELWLVITSKEALAKVITQASLEYEDLAAAQAIASPKSGAGAGGSGSGGSGAVEAAANGSKDQFPEDSPRKDQPAPVPSVAPAKEEPASVPEVAPKKDEPPLVPQASPAASKPTAPDPEPAPDPAPEPASASSPAPSPTPAAGSMAVDEELHLVVHIDQALNLREVVVVRRGATIGDVKEMLAKRDVTGMFKASDFKLAWESSPRQELSNHFRLSGSRTALTLML